MRIRIVALGVVLVLLASTQIVAQNGGDLFQQGLALQTANGDIPGAIQIYERILRDFRSNRPLAARATFQLGRAYESLGQAKSRDYYDQVVNQYADQADMVAEANARLAAMAKAGASIEVVTPNSRAPFGFAISPDGRNIVFAAPLAGRPHLWLHNLETGKAAPIAGADIVPPPVQGGPGAILPFWSPDSKSIAFFNNGKLKRIDAEGGTATVLADGPEAGGGAWSPDGTILFAPSLASGLRRVPADGSGPAVPVAGIGPGGCPKFLPDGRRFLFFQPSEASARGQVAQVLRLGSLDSSERKVLPVQAFSGTFVAPDQLLYATDQGLFAQRLDLDTLELTGSPLRLSEQVAAIPSSCVLAVSSSAAGTLAYRTSSSLVPERQFVWLDRQGQQTGVFLPDPSNPCCIHISPDGRTVTFGRDGGGAPAGSLWTIEDSPGAEARLIYSGARVGVWSPAGDSLAIGLYRPVVPYGPYLAVERLDGAFRYLRQVDRESPTDWSRDGRFLLFERSSADLLALPIQGNLPRTAGEPIPVAQTPADERLGRFSPDSKWIAYQSKEPEGRNEVFVQPFPGSPDSRKRISLSGGTTPKWSADGRELYFLSADFHLMVVSVKLPENGQDIELGTPAPLFPVALPANSEFEPSPDGKRFLINRPLGSAADPPPIRVLSNWTRAK